MPLSFIEIHNIGSPIEVIQKSHLHVSHIHVNMGRRWWTYITCECQVHLCLFIIFYFYWFYLFFVMFVVLILVMCWYWVPPPRAFLVKGRQYILSCIKRKTWANIRLVGIHACWWTHQWYFSILFYPLFHFCMLVLSIRALDLLDFNSQGQHQLIMGKVIPKQHERHSMLLPTPFLPQHTQKDL